MADLAPLSRLLDIAEIFAASSLMSFGGTNAVIPHLRNEVVTINAWLDDRRFAEAYALAQVTPGPTTTVVTLLGFQAGGIAGAAIATMAMILPSSTIALLAASVWQTSTDAIWHRVLERGLGPVGVGLIGSAGIVVAQSVDKSATAWLVTASSCAALTLTKANPLVVIAFGGLAGLLAF